MENIKMRRIEKAGLIYTYREDGIHEFAFTGDDTGLDHFFDILKNLLENTPADKVLRYLVDATNSSGRSSMTELIRRFRKLEAQLPVRAAGRTAIIHDGSLLLTLANTFVDTLAPDKDKTRFFVKTKRHYAIKWLLEQA
jgi:hypothetical protein